MARGTVQPPWDEEVAIWEALFIKKEPLYTMPPSLGLTEYRLRKSKKRFPKLSFAEWSHLPGPLQQVHPCYREYEAQARKPQKSTEVTPDPRLMKHFDELAGTAKVLAHHAQRLLRYRDNDVEAYGNIVVGLSFRRKTTGQRVSETVDPLEEFRYAKEHRVDPYLAECLFAHYEDTFGKSPFASWEQVTMENVAKELFTNLSLLSHSEHLRFCPSCPSCKAIKEG